MITEQEAKRIITNDKKESPYSCAIMEYFYVFCMKKEGTIFYAVDKKTGKIYPYSPSLDFIGYNQAEKHIYGASSKNESSTLLGKMAAKVVANQSRDTTFIPKKNKH